MITIITATLNAGKTIERSIGSLAGQDAPFEHIVIDGGSCDGTAEICGAHKEIVFIAAPGSSIYEAWNIGVQRATGDSVMFLNADDEFVSGALNVVTAAFAQDADIDLVAGHADMVADVAPGAILQHFVAAPDGRLDVRQLALGVPAINAMAFRKRLFETRGAFPTHFRAAGDRAMLLALALGEPALRVRNVDETLYRYFSHAGSLTLHRSLKQRLMIAREHFDLASELLRRPLTPGQKATVTFWRRREGGVGFLRALCAGRLAEAYAFASRSVAAELDLLTGNGAPNH